MLWKMKKRKKIELLIEVDHQAVEGEDEKDNLGNCKRRQKNTSGNLMLAVNKAQEKHCRPQLLSSCQNPNQHFQY